MTCAEKCPQSHNVFKVHNSTSTNYQNHSNSNHREKQRSTSSTIVSSDKPTRVKNYLMNHRACFTSNQQPPGPASSLPALATHLFSKMPALFSTPRDSETQHPPSQSITDENGSKWRLCAGAAVLNSKNQLLIGERIGKPGSWQAPQGGVDGGPKQETVIEAASRELYEEVGLKNNDHVILEQIDCELPVPLKCKYKTQGTGSWLEEEGFVGQELNWVIFRCANSNLERDPSQIANLAGLNGETPEFSAVRWENIDWVVENVWEKKAKPYRVLEEALQPLMKRWDERCADPSFTGRWARDATRSVGVVEGLIARGLSEEKAKKKAEEPYIQDWQQHRDKREWSVLTYDIDGETPRRELLYPLGDFEEVYEGESTLFGGTDGGVVKRTCFYLAEKDADESNPIAHVTVSETPRGREESLRYMKNGELILRRTFWHSWRSDKVVSTEVFVKSERTC